VDVKHDHQHTRTRYVYIVSAVFETRRQTSIRVWWARAGRVLSRAALWDFPSSFVPLRPSFRAASWSEHSVPEAKYSLLMSIYLFVPVYVHSMGLGGDKVLPLQKLRTPAATAATVVDELILGSYIIVININGLL
jgi:hypothetical protein